MVNLKNYKTEIFLYIVVFLWLLFVLTNSNQTLGNAYLWFIGISLFLLLINDSTIRVNIKKREGGNIEAFFAGVVGWVIILAVSYFIFRFIDPAKANLHSILGSFGAANPAFSNSKIVNWVTLSLAVGYAETQLWSRVLEFLSDKFNIQITRKNMFSLAFIILAIVLSVLFVIFHFTSKGVNATASLLVVFIMMFISLLMVAYFEGETRQSIWMHVISNGVAGYLLLASGGLLI